MDLTELSLIVRKVTPILGEALLSVNPLAGILVGSIANLFDADKNNTQDIINKINNDTNAEYKLKQIECDNQEMLAKYGDNDRANARAREENIYKITGKSDYLLDFIAVLVILGFFILCIINYFVELKDDHILMILIGQISSGFMLVLSYYFGASNKD